MIHPRGVSCMPCRDGEPSRARGCMARRLCRAETQTHAYSKAVLRLCGEVMSRNLGLIKRGLDTTHFFGSIRQVGVKPALASRNLGRVHIRPCDMSAARDGWSESTGAASHGTGIGIFRNSLLLRRGATRGNARGRCGARAPPRRAALMNARACVTVGPPPYARPICPSGGARHFLAAGPWRERVKH